LQYGSIDQPLAKLSRAAEHYRLILNQYYGGFTRMRVPIKVEQHGPLEYRLRVGAIEPLAPELPLIFGDAYYDLRAALDYLIYQLHVRRFRGTVGPDAARDSAFPILSSRRVYTSGARRGTLIPTSEWKEIKRLGQPIRRAIEWLQPYHGRNDRNRELRPALADIRDLNNIDKHRELHLGQKYVMGVPSPSFPAQLGFRQNPAFGVVLESGAYVDTWTFSCPPPAGQIRQSGIVQAGMAIEPTRGDRIEALAHLGGSILAVQMVIDRFRRLFPAPSPSLDLSWVRRFDPVLLWTGLLLAVFGGIPSGCHTGG
jgi:hypothetical protein